MICYKYNEQITPPAPFAHVTVSCQETTKIINNLPAQLDCAADRSVIPGKLVGELGLVPLDEIPVGGFGGQVFLVPTYRIQLALRGLPSVVLEVLAHPEEPYVLLGRDVLNQHRIVLDGPQLTLTIDGN